MMRRGAVLPSQKSELRLDGEIWILLWRRRIFSDRGSINFREVVGQSDDFPLPSRCRAISER